MVDVIQFIGDPLRYWWDKNVPNGGARFVANKSNLRVQYKEIYYVDLSPSTITPSTIDTSSFSNDTDLSAKQTFSVNKKTTNSFTWSLKEEIHNKLYHWCEDSGSWRRRIRGYVDF